MINPIDGKPYRRYIHTVGIDVCEEDGRIYKWPANTYNSDESQSFFIGKYNDIEQDMGNLFNEPYRVLKNMDAGLLAEETRCTEKEKFADDADEENSDFSDEESDE